MIRSMDEIRSQIDQMVDHERFLLAGRETHAAALEERKTWLIAVAAVIFTVLAGAALALARLEARRRRKATEENVRLHSDLERREKKIRRLVDANIIGIFIWDLEGRIVEANDAFLRIVGYDREDLVSGRVRWTDLTPPEWLERDARQWVPELKKTGILPPFEKEYVRKDGSRVPVLIGAASFEEGGNHGVAFVLDLTERKRAEEELRRSEAYLAEAEALSKGGSWAWNPTTQEIIYWSQERYRLFGFAPEAGIPSLEALLQRIHPEDRARWLADADRAVQIRGDSETDFRIVLPDGEIKHLYGIGHPVFSKSGELLEIIGAAMDITERKRAEEALQKAQAELAHVTRVTTMNALTASIAHEVNQPLGAIATNANAALRWLARQPPELDQARETLRRIIKDGRRAGEVIGRVRSAPQKDRDRHGAGGSERTHPRHGRPRPRRGDPASDPAADRAGAPPSAHKGGPGAVAAGASQSPFERHRCDEGCPGAAARAADPVPAQRIQGGGRSVWRIPGSDWTREHGAGVRGISTRQSRRAWA